MHVRDAGGVPRADVVVEGRPGRVAGRGIRWIRAKQVLMLVTCDVSQLEMWPYVTSAAALSESHAATAVLMLSLSRGAAAAAAARHRMHAKDAFISRKAAGLPWMGSPGRIRGTEVASVCRHIWGAKPTRKTGN